MSDMNRKYKLYSRHSSGDHVIENAARIGSFWLYYVVLLHFG